MSMKTIYYLPIAVLMFLAAACQRADVNTPRGSLDAPGQVTVTRVTNFPGRSVIHYSLPNDDNLRYVKAKYSPRLGVQSEMNASYFTDSIVVEGFYAEGDYPVELYSVSTGGAFSEPVKVTVTPTKPSYQLISENMKASSIFGGFLLEAENPVGEKVFVTIEKQDESGEWIALDQFYVGENAIKIIERGQKSVESYYRYTVEDHWGNISEPREFSLTPMFEQKLDKKIWKQAFGPGEVDYSHYGTATFNKMFDDIILKADQACWQTSASGTHPADINKAPIVVTIDLGATYCLSRMEEWPVFSTITSYNSRYEKYFSGGDPKDFELYGATVLDQDTPLFDEDGNLNPNWTLIFKGTNKRPSGSNNSALIDQITDEEEYMFSNGIPREFEFERVDIPVRYFKMRFLSNWGGRPYVVIGEISLYGQQIQ